MTNSDSNTWTRQTTHKLGDAVAYTTGSIDTSEPLAKKVLLNRRKENQE